MIKIIKTQKGAALIISYYIIGILAILSAGVFQNNLSEMKLAELNQNSLYAFWVAEGGLSEAIYNLKQSQAWTPPLGPQNFGGGSYTVTLTDTPSSKQITVRGTVNNAQREVSAEMPYINRIFDNTLSSGSNLSLIGVWAQLEVWGKTRLGGKFTKSGPGTSAWFEDKLENQNPIDTTITIPDTNGNGTSDEFSDFTAYFQNIISQYNPDEVVYIQGNGTVNIFPNSGLAGKKILYVEGTSPGSGGVNIFFDATWQNNQDLTIISTGTIDYIEPLQYTTNSRLNTISWDEYHEYAIFANTHKGIIYAHDDIRFYDIFDVSTTTGNIIANKTIKLTEIVALKKIYFSDWAQTGNVPPGFENLLGTNPKLSSDVINWQESI